VPVIHLAIAACHEQMRNKALARRHLAAAVDAFEAQGSFEPARGACLELAELLAGMREPREALAAVRRAVRCAERASDDSGASDVRIDTLVGGARLLIARDQHGPALELARAAMQESERTTDAGRIARIAECLFRCGEGDAAMEVERRAISILERRRDLEGIAAASSRIAGVFASRRQTAQAVEWIRETVELASLAGAKPLHAIGLERLGEFLQAVHRHAEALDALGQLLAVLRSLDDVPAARIAAIHRRIATIQHVSGDFTGAVAHERLALDHFELAENWREGGDAAYEFADLKLERRDFEAALLLCRRGHHFASRSRDPEELAIAHERIGDALRRACRFREAIAEYVAALGHVNRSPFPLTFRSACIRHEHGRCLLALNRFREATRWLGHALREFQLIAEWGHAAHVAMRMAQAESQLERPAEAARLRKLAVDLAERSGSDEVIAEIRERCGEDG
jgi:tetratricopeptide (TPR) repeat protein